ncbi:DinB family protein [Polymorphum gilvum]|uniref:DinB family n=1 Tax=Polymorphum gilvum (strain LMG 25793 / CGMCC 1.9160 / SL003B-26A1) TaxID=991905 RepID=F2J456_POLGS|nr:DinB family protein [Polymorphum gilvum]ADZ69982.1 DinB family [Polymorphum gilvum SL003B-26A1]
MTDPILYRRQAAYNFWMTNKLYATCGQMSDAERKADRGAFFRSIHSTLNHLLFGDRIWMGRFTGRSHEHRGMGVDIYDDFGELEQAHRAMAAEIEAFAAGLTPEWLAGTLRWTNTTGTRTLERPRWLLVSHLFNHQTHHRGQITTLLSQSGLDIGVTDLPFMPDLGD